MNANSKRSSPAQRLGVKVFSCDAQIQLFQRTLKKIEAPEGNLLHVAWSRHDYADSVVLGTYLAGRFEACRKWCRLVGEATHYYLLGDWKEKVANDDGIVDPHCWFEARPCLNWTLYLEPGLGWSSVAEAWDLVDSLCDFLTPKVEYDDESGKAGREYYLTLADWLRHDDLSRVASVKGMRGAGSKSYHLLCDILTAIQGREEAQLAKAFTVFIKHFLKGQRHEHHFPLNATFLWNYARKKGVRCDLPEDTAMYLFELPQASATP